jgi:hypothetical protein
MRFTNLKGILFFQNYYFFLFYRYPTLSNNEQSLPTPSIAAISSQGGKIRFHVNFVF